MTGFVHGMSGTHIHRAWIAMLDRTSGNVESYLGVTHCDRWTSFELFLEDMQATHFEGAVLSRKGDAGPYCKENCRWVTKSANVREARENYGVMHKLADGRYALDVARENNIPDETMRMRIRRGWDPLRAATEPARGYNRVWKKSNS